MDVIMVKLRSLMQRTSLNNALGMERSFPCVSVSCYVRSALCASHTYILFLFQPYTVTVNILPYLYRHIGAPLTPSADPRNISLRMMAS